MYDWMEAELKGVQQDIYLICVVSTMPFSLGGIEVGDEPAQLCRIAYATEAHLRRV
jgi:hypothetical protein